MIEFEYFTPTSIQELCSITDTLIDYKFISGGTDLLPKI